MVAGVSRPPHWGGGVGTVAGGPDTNIWTALQGTRRKVSQKQAPTGSDSPRPGLSIFPFFSYSGGGQNYPLHLFPTVASCPPTNSSAESESPHICIFPNLIVMFRPFPIISLSTFILFPSSVYICLVLSIFLSKSICAFLFRAAVGYVAVSLNVVCFCCTKGFHPKSRPFSSFFMRRLMVRPASGRTHTAAPVGQRTTTFPSPVLRTGPTRVLCHGCKR